MNANAAPDRYVSFVNIDFEGNMARVLAHLRRHIDNPETGNAFWDRFMTRLAAIEAGENAITDKLLLLHSHVYYMVELFEAQDDETALQDLKRLEEQCF
jgi:N(2)-fixation sustaining protein CowN